MAGIAKARLMAAALTVLLVLLAASACAPNAPTPPLPTATVQAPSAPPTPAAGRAVIHGVLVPLGQSELPSELRVYLGDVLTMTNGLPVVRLERSTAPSIVPAADGSFVFGNAAPGRYAVIAATPDASLLLRSPTDGQSILLNVAAGQVVDLGRLELPVSGGEM